VTGIERLLLDEPVLKLRVHLGAVAFMEIFFNVETGKTSFALIKDRQRIFGADNTRGWHTPPFDSPESDHSCEEMVFTSFLRPVEQNQDKWFEAKTDA
jgi:hypothetical protein